MLTVNRFGRTVRTLAALALAGLVLAGCNSTEFAKATQPMSRAMKSRIAKKGMDERSPILVRIFKEESALEVWKVEKATGRFALLKTYDICKWSGKLGPKEQEGDRQAPEGFYTIHPAQMNPNSQYHLAFNMGFPNQFDREHGRTGAHLMVHGACSSSGCYSMGDENIAEIYTLARFAFAGGQRAFQVQAFPFRMTPANLARRQRNPNYAFWKDLKRGSDLFELTRQQPAVGVCSKRYTFGLEAQPGVRYDANGLCGPSAPEPVVAQLRVKEATDADAEAKIAARMDEADFAKVEVADLKRDPKQKNEIPDSLLALTAPAGATGTGMSAIDAAFTAPEASPAPAEASAGDPVAIDAAPVSAPQAEVSEAAAPATEAESDGFLSRLKKKLW